jgi:hypothetical protein
MCKNNRLFLIRVTIFLFLVHGVISCKQESGYKEDGPYLIMAQRPTPAGYPAVIVKNMEHIENQPFDGMFLNSVAGWNLMNGQSVSYDSIYEEFAVLKGVFKKFRHNFIYIFNNFPGDFWDDEVWEITAQNFAGMAKVAKELGFSGIVYDNEEYRPKKWHNYGENYRNPAYDLNQHRDQVILRGKQVMEAMVAEFPSIEVFTYHGPYLSEPNYRTPSIILGQAGTWDNYELLGPFFVGLMLGKGDSATIIDGGEVYQYRTKDDFKNSYEIRKYEIASEETNSWFIPYQLRIDWPNHINISFGVYNRQWMDEYPMNPSIMNTTLTNALEATDKYVWYYTEYDNWLEPGKMPEEWIRAITSARKVAD